MRITRGSEQPRCRTLDVVPCHLLPHEQLCMVPFIVRRFIKVPVPQRDSRTGAHAYYRHSQGQA